MSEKKKLVGLYFVYDDGTHEYQKAEEDEIPTIKVPDLIRKFIRGDGEDQHAIILPKRVDVL